MLVEIWYDVVCPWCFIGNRRFAAALESFPHRDQVDVQLRAFELDPTPRPAMRAPAAEALSAHKGIPLDDTRAMVDRVTAIAAADGIVMRFDDQHHGNTRDAHRLLHLAREQGRQRQLADALFAAHFSAGASVIDHESLTGIAATVGLDPSRVRDVLAGRDYDDAVDADEDLARQLGITGVPFFVLDRRLGVSGAQPTATLRAALDQAWAERAA